MNSQFNFVVDSTIKGRIYPALARHQGRPYTQSWREFGQHWPYTTPLRLEEYCREHSIVINNYAVDTDCPDNSYYPICLGFFDFEIDYFELMSPEVRKKLRQDKLRVLFMYHEGDNPRRIKNRLDSLAENHLLPPDCYVFVSANTAADQLPGFVTFHDFELWYYQRNLTSTPYMIHREPRQRDFTCLSRLHKWWRATAMADLHRTGLLSNSYWSYCEAPYDADTDCPIEVDMISRLRYDRTKFLQQAPYVSDELSDFDRNNHAVMVPKYYGDSYCQIVLESQFDVDQSGGAFVTEKTFKPIKHGQLFFVAGGAGSLQVLRDLGYQVFDDLLDNSYDTIPNHTQRWERLRDSIEAARPHLSELFEAARPQLEHNQRLFVANKADRLNSLIRKIHEQYS
jgi:hypothetical protein